MEGQLHAFEETLKDEYAGYVLIRCSKPDSTGNMNVDLSYGGDTALASYLVKGAQESLDQIIDQEIDEN